MLNAPVSLILTFHNSYKRSNAQLIYSITVTYVEQVEIPCVTRIPATCYQFTSAGSLLLCIACVNTAHFIAKAMKMEKKY